MSIRHLLYAATLAAFSLTEATGRDLVVTLRDGSRHAYPLSTKADEHVVMRRIEGAICIGDEVYPLADIRELRIYKETPADAIVVGVRSVEADPAAVGTTAATQLPVDLAGRRMKGAPLRRGIYVVEHKKVVVK